MGVQAFAPVNQQVVLGAQVRLKTVRSQLAELGAINTFLA